MCPQIKKKRKNWRHSTCAIHCWELSFILLTNFISWSSNCNIIYRLKFFSLYLQKHIDHYVMVFWLWAHLSHHIRLISPPGTYTCSSLTAYDICKEIYKWKIKAGEINREPTLAARRKISFVSGNRKEMSKYDESSKKTYLIMLVLTCYQTVTISMLYEYWKCLSAQWFGSLPSTKQRVIQVPISLSTWLALKVWHHGDSWMSQYYFTKNNSIDDKDWQEKQDWTRNTIRCRAWLDL